MSKLRQTSTVKMGEESIKSMKSCSQTRDYSKCIHMRTSGRRGEKSVIRYVRTKHMALTRCCEIFLGIGQAS